MYNWDQSIMFSTMHNSKAITTNHILLALQKLGLKSKQKIAKPIQNQKENLQNSKNFKKTTAFTYLQAYGLIPMLLYLHCCTVHPSY
jgi:hypothetical protein